jgi:hypothetical protein
VFTAKLHCLQRIRCSLWILVSVEKERSLSNCVGYSKSGVRSWILVSTSNEHSLSNYCVVCSKSLFPPELRWLHRIMCLVQNSCVFSESAFVVEVCCLQRISFHSRITLSATNQCSLRNYSVCNELGVHCRILVSAANECSLLICVLYSESIFEAEFWCLRWRSFRCRIVLSTANQVFPAEFWSL